MLNKKQIGENNMNKQTTPIYVGYIENGSYVNAFVSNTQKPNQQWDQILCRLKQPNKLSRDWGSYRKSIIESALARGCKAWIAMNDQIEVVA